MSYCNFEIHDEIINEYGYIVCLCIKCKLCCFCNLRVVFNFRMRFEKNSKR